MFIKTHEKPAVLVGQPDFEAWLLICYYWLLIVDTWLSTFNYWLLIVVCWLLIADYFFFIIDQWLLIIDSRLLIIWLLIGDFLIIDYLLLAKFPGACYACVVSEILMVSTPVNSPDLLKSLSSLMFLNYVERRRALSEAKGECVIQGLSVSG